MCLSTNSLAHEGRRTTDPVIHVVLGADTEARWSLLLRRAHITSMAILLAARCAANTGVPRAPTTKDRVFLLQCDCNAASAALPAAADSPRLEAEGANLTRLAGPDS